MVVDWFGLGRLLDVRGQVDAAAGCYELALEDEREPSARRRAATALASHYRRTGQPERLLDLWDREAQAGILPRWQGLERLAMVWEWELCDPQRALTHTERALAALNGDGDPCRARLLHRRERLLRRVKVITRSLRGPEGAEAISASEEIASLRSR
ncbi:MAG: hypothetical protein AUI83_26435 [Armatimonadetes bacterium 13_1_40CM_3_65_7]|nr:MAG: hypothetical protein AUI83_26435 [Armatimonadetes bacterium 13_1_40CM_3_65_7]